MRRKPRPSGTTEPLPVGQHSGDAAPKDAWMFRMPFGQHVGKTLKMIRGEPGGLDYLRWLATQPGLRAKTRACLESALASCKAKGSAKAKPRRERGAEPRYIGRAGREVLPAAKPEHATVAPWEDHPCNVME